MTRLAVSLEKSLGERLKAQAKNLNLQPEELAVKAIRNILFLLEMKAMQVELRPLFEIQGFSNEEELYTQVS